MIIVMPVEWSIWLGTIMRVLLRLRFTRKIVAMPVEESLMIVNTANLTAS